MYPGTRLICFALVTVFACWFQKSPYGSTGPGQALLGRIAFVAIAIAVWHGAYDSVLAEPRFRPWIGRWWLPVFAAGYLLLVGATLVSWHLAPAFTLVAFLTYSSWHFGTEQDVEGLTLGSAVSGFAIGAIPIAAACSWHPVEVSTIFHAMLGSGANTTFAAGLVHVCASSRMWIVGLAALGTMLGFRGQALSTRLSLTCLIALELILFWCCDPVIAFAVFFCFWHTPEHLVSTSLDRDGLYTPRIMWHNLRAGLVPWIASLAGLTALLALRPQSIAGYASGLFILLSALTVPHMGLNEMRRFADPDRSPV